MSDARFVLAAPATLRQEVKKSIFVANAANIAVPDAALDFVAAVSDRGATHNCWAYRIGQQYRFNDDGEPGGTAGRPILQAIDGQLMDRTVVVVTRWYGGIKLGAGGLVAVNFVPEELRLRLVESKTFGSGCVALRYSRQ